VITADELRTRLRWAGRVYGPSILFDAWFGNEISRETLTATIGDVWSAAEYPQDALPAFAWIAMFEIACYTVDGNPAELPTAPVRLYRGSPYSRRRRWAWTSDLEVAKRFATGQIRGREQGQVYVVEAPPKSLLCQNNDRKEGEYVVNTRGLKIKPYAELEHRC
jgi:hypothetical protein